MGEKTNLTGILTIAVALLICAGILNQIVYYFFFHVPIIYFLNTSELLILFADDIIIISIAAIFSFLFSYSPSSSTSSNEVTTKSKGRYTTRIIFVTMFITIGIILYLNDNSYAKAFFWIAFSYTIIFIISGRLFYVMRRLSRSGERKEEIEYLKQLSFIIMFIGIIISYSIFDAASVKYGAANNGTAFKVDDTLITSDTSVFFIGKTQNFLFYYEKDKKKSHAIPMERISEISFSNIN